MDVERNGGPPSILDSKEQPRRLKMMHGNKVDVSSIIINSMQDYARRASTRQKR